MSSLMKICDADADNKLINPFVVDKYKQGHIVGERLSIQSVEGFIGQQRVGIVFDGIFIVTTSYISTNLV